VRVCVLTLLVWLFAVPCEAELFPLREHVRQIDSWKVGVALDSSSFFGRVDGARYALVAPTLGASLRIGEAVLEAALPFVYVRERSDEAGTLNNIALGNPWLGLSYLPDCSCGLSRLSVGIAPDLATASAPLDQTALSLARTAQGNWDGYLWIPDLMPLVVGASTLMQLGILHLVWDGDVIVGLPGGGRNKELGFQSAGDASLWFGARVALGARVHAVTYPTFSGDRFQSALSAYLRARIGGQSVGVRYLENLDGPYGIASSGGRVWGLGLFIATTL